uniref:Uncharacterized protein n=1 Tax=Lutzomyia longipalpis TaxID=7200 RepID=A0A1B0C9H0_LUTLO
MCGICGKAHHTLLHPYKNTAEFKGNAEEKEEPHLKSKAEIDRELLKFWEVEGAQRKTTIQDHACEEHFTQSHARSKDGKYIVHLPFKDDPEKLGDSKEQALVKLERLEKEFAVNDQLYYDYKDFMDESIAAGHISLTEDTDGAKYYLPHHAVTNSSTKKREIVFEASSKTTTGLSLNSILNKGLKIHEDLRSILTRWRKHHYVFTARVEEIVKQILIEPAERDFLRILWREDPREPIKEYTLNTVTKVLTPATYLSFRMLMQLALDDREYCPRAAAAMNDFHVDQLISGGASKGSDNGTSSSIL